MPLFYKQHLTQTQKYYHVSGNNRKLIVGLGNIGEKYHGTRHNVGFFCLNSFAKEHDFLPWTAKKDFSCLFSKKLIGETDIILAKPTTYMNRSGEALSKISRFYQIDPKSILVIHDDLDIPFGQIRTRLSGSDAGNKGIRSINAQIGTNYGRIRIGIGSSSKVPAEKYVLTQFNEQEQVHLPALAREVVSICTDFIFSGQLVSETRSFLV